MTQPPSSTGIAKLANASTKKDYPFKRKPRRHSKEATRLAVRELATFLAAWEPIHEAAATLDGWEPGDRGRPPDLPPAAHLIFGVVYALCGNDRDAEAALGDAPAWHAVRRALVSRYPRYRGLRPDAQPISRREFWRFREAHGITDEILNDLRGTFRELAASQAIGMGMFDSSKGSVSHPAIENTFTGDGTVIKPHYKGSPSKRQLNRETGELEPVKYDPDANLFKFAGGEEETYGIKFGFVEAWLPYDSERVENERLILDVFNVRHEPGYDEASQGIESVKALVRLLPNAQAIAWDMALHGTHLDITRRLGLIDIVKVNKTAARAGKKIPPPKDDHGSGRTGHVFRLCDGTTQEIALYTFDGHPHMEVVAEGKKHKVPLTKTRLRRVGHRSGGYRWYGDYTAPDDARVPAPQRGAVVAIRLDRTDDDGKHNRAEHLRPITIHDPPVGPNPDPDHHSEFDQRYVPRPGAESINRWYKQRFTDGRAPAVGRRRIEFMLICGALLNNAKAALAHQQRLRQAA